MNQYTSTTGGGSGEIYDIFIEKDELILAVIGQGGKSAYAEYTSTSGSTGTTANATGTQGESTTFRDLIFPGGGGAYCTKGTTGSSGGTASGSIASAGDTSTVPGYGNINNTEQTYGNGGYGELVTANKNSEWVMRDGQPGAIIITYLGSTAP